MPENRGIDVSSWQGEIQWDLVKKAGVAFAIIRSAVGTHPDKMFEKNMRAAQAQGIPCGVYHYSMASNVAQAQAEAKLALSQIRPYSLAYPVAFDLEDKIHHPLSNAQRTDLVEAFCAQITAAQYHPVLYTSLWWFSSMLEQSRIAAYDKWVAQWAPRCTYEGKVHLWQYSNKGRVPGIVGDVDLDIAYAYPLPPSPPPAPPKAPPAAGARLRLPAGTALYSSASAAQAAKKVGGNFWVYDGLVFSGKIRVTNRQDAVKRLPIEEFVSGYLRLEDIL